MMGRLEQGLGILLVLIILLDIFLTVLYARIGMDLPRLSGEASAHLEACFSN
jgi:hypothetical protein